jgi:hypothetical protein
MIEAIARIPKSMRLPLVIAGFMATLFSTLALTNRPSGWLQGSSKGFDRISAQDDPPAMSAELPSVVSPGGPKVRVKTGCEECGVIDSIRQVTLVGNARPTYELTIRMRDGATRIVSLASHGNWRPHERITLLGGETRSVR